MKLKIQYIIIPAILIVIAIGAAVYFYIQYQNIKTQLTDPAKSAQAATREIIEKVGKLIELPTDEEPTVATISDKEKLKDQPFFAKAKNGDKVLIFANAKKAILYDPTANKIIDVAPVNIGTGSAIPASSTIKVALYNGTDTVGLTQTAEKILKGKVTNIDVVVKDNAKKKDYQKTLVIDLTGSNNAAANLIAKALNAQLDKLPENEEKPVESGNGQIDLLIILGKDIAK